MKFFNSLLTAGMFLVSPALFAGDLDTKIEADYEDMALGKALRKLRKDTDISMVLHPSLNLNRKVNIIVEKAKVKTILAWLKEQSDMDYYIEDDVIICMSKKAMAQRVVRLFKASFTSKDYYISDLLGELKDYRAPEISLGGGEEGGGGITIEESDSAPAEPITGQGMVDLIRETIDPASWDHASIDISNGTLLVTTSPKVHEKITKLLNDIRQRHSRLVHVTARLHRLDDEDLKAIAKDTEGLVLDDDDGKYFEKGVINIVKGTGFSTQRFNLTSVEQQAYLRDLTSVVNVGVASMDPEIGYVSTGFMVDVRPTVDSKLENLRVELNVQHSQITTLKDEKFETIDFLSGTEDIPGQRQKVVRNITMPKVKQYSSRSTLNLPAGKWYPKVLGADADGHYIVAFMKFDVIQSK